MAPPRPSSRNAMLGEKTDSVPRNRSRTRSPQPKKKKVQKAQQPQQPAVEETALPLEQQPLIPKHEYEPVSKYEYVSGDSEPGPSVPDNDIFLLPSKDYEIMLALVGVAIIVRLYKIWQPSSVVFDEVQ